MMVLMHASSHTQRAYHAHNYKWS